MFFVKIVDFRNCLLVADPEVFNKPSHVVDLVLKVLVVCFNQHDFFLLAQFLFNQKFLPFPLLNKLLP